jgi:hypothetical protein
MSAFRTALAQLNSSTPAVDSAAIYAPYRASEAVTGQLGTGLQQAELNSGQAAQSQYGNALSTAQQQAAQFGISAGAGANPTALQNTGAAPLAQQTNAYAAAAPAAAAQWQALLERTAGAKVADAQLQRETGLTQARQSLATALPGAIQNEEQLGFQKQTQRENMGLAYSQLSAKDRQYAQQYGLDALKLKLDAGTTAARTDLETRRYNETVRHNKATEAGAAVRAQRLAKTNKVLGVSQVLSAIKIATPSASSTTKVAKGWDVQVQPYDKDGNPLGPVTKMHGPSADWAPAGYKNVGGATTHYNTAPAKPGATPGLKLSQWNKGVGILMTNNPGMSKAQAMKYMQQITPKPKK